MTRQDLLEELYEIIKTISTIPPKPFERFCKDQDNKSDKELMSMLKIGRKVMKAKK